MTSDDMPPVDLRATILEASVRLIEEQGISALSLREVARRAGVSHQAPYHHFRDRETILATLVEEGFHRLADRLEAALQRPRKLAAKLSSLAEAYVRFALDAPAHFRLMFRPELVDLGRFPEAERAGARALSILQNVVAGLNEELDERTRVVWQSYAWSLPHGLASLMLDGSLGQAFPTTRERDAHISLVAQQFGLTMAAATRKTRQGR